MGERVLRFLEAVSTLTSSEAPGDALSVSNVGRAEHIMECPINCGGSPMRSVAPDTWDMGEYRPQGIISISVGIDLLRSGEL